MDFKQINTVYFVGIGGIGMSALARYFNARGKYVLGYDKTQTQLTLNLEKEGVKIHYEDLGEKALNGLQKEDTLVVFTPAIPKTMGELLAFKAANYTCIKRAKALGVISHAFETFAVAGTHGKTTTSAILAHVLYQNKEKCNAFIGGITTNYNSNCLIDKNAERVVVEADEFDRSFLQLKPNHAIITTMDADHLDIYGDGEQLKTSFFDFVQLINPKGSLFIHADLKNNQFTIDPSLKMATYGFSDQADWKGTDLHYENGRFYFQIQHKNKIYKKVEFGLPGKHNAENALAVFAMCTEIGMAEQEIRKAFQSFKGVKRRFDFHIRRDDLVIIDDYAHHPTEIKAFLTAVKTIYPTKKITAVFQPHLFSRTQDFMDDFAKVLSLADELFLLDIYPARELPIEGVTSRVLLNKIDMPNKKLVSKSAVVNELKQSEKEVIVIIGAGDIDTCIQPIVNSFDNPTQEALK